MFLIVIRRKISKLLLIFLSLMACWFMFSAELYLDTIIIGIVMVISLLTIIPPKIKGKDFVINPIKIIWLLIVFFIELFKSNLRVAKDVLTPRLTFYSAFLKIPLNLKENFQKVFYANLITLTPGTLTIDISRDRNFILIHVMNVSDPAQLKKDLANSFERLVDQAFPSTIQKT